MDTTPAPTAAPLNREAWLYAVAERMWPMLLKHGGAKPKSYRVSCGWPSKSALLRASSKSRRIGEAWHAGSGDDSREIFISPALENPVAVADVLLHEMIHAALPGEVGHRAPFPQIAKKLGLEGKPTATYAGEALAQVLAEITAEVGPYPHAKLDATPHRKQGTRMMKVQCPDCGYTLRTTRVWLEVGVPTCPCGATMESDDPTTNAEPLSLAASWIEYRTADGRFILRTSRENKRQGAWIVTDLEAQETSRREVEDPETGAVREIVQYRERVTSRRDKADALAFVQALRDGLTEWSVLELEEAPEEDGVDPWDEEGEDDTLPDYSDEFGEDFLADDEEETPDYPEDQPEDADEYERMTDYREAAGERTSKAIVASGGAGAMD